MFTGIITSLGQVLSLRRGTAGATLALQTALPTEPAASDPVKLGDSISVSGVCLTVTSLQRGRLTFDLSRETLDTTALGTLTTGQSVHLERAMQLGHRLDGHLVQGHIDGLARLVQKSHSGAGWELTYAFPEALAPFIVPKGSIALDGVSLTIARLADLTFTVAVIPLTADVTLLAQAALGAAVHVETDIIGRYVHHLLHRAPAASSAPSGLTPALLAEHGFLTR